MIRDTSQKQCVIFSNPVLLGGSMGRGEKEDRSGIPLSLPPRPDLVIKLKNKEVVNKE